VSYNAANTPPLPSRPAPPGGKGGRKWRVAWLTDHIHQRHEAAGVLFSELTLDRMLTLVGIVHMRKEALSLST